MTNPFQPDPLHDHTRLVDAATAASVTPPPPQWTELRERFTAFTALGSAAPMCARLIAAIVDGDPAADVAVLRAAAYAEPLHQAKVLEFAGRGPQKLLQVLATSRTPQTYC
jgi:hypothetical protein